MTEYPDLGIKHLLPDFLFLLQISHLHTNSQSKLAYSERSTLGGWETFAISKQSKRLSQ